MPSQSLQLKMFVKSHSKASPRQGTNPLAMDKDLEQDGMEVKESITAGPHLQHWFKITEEKVDIKSLYVFGKEKKN